MDCRREGKDRRGLDAQRQGSGWMDRQMMGTEEDGDALCSITEEEENDWTAPGQNRTSR